MALHGTWWALHGPAPALAFPGAVRSPMADRPHHARRSPWCAPEVPGPRAHRAWPAHCAPWLSFNSFVLHARKFFTPGMGVYAFALTGVTEPDDDSAARAARRRAQEWTTTAPTWMGMFR